DGVDQGLGPQTASCRVLERIDAAAAAGALAATHDVAVPWESVEQPRRAMAEIGQGYRQIGLAEVERGAEVVMLRLVVAGAQGRAQRDAEPPSRQGPAHRCLILSAARACGSSRAAALARARAR